MAVNLKQIHSIRLESDGTSYEKCVVHYSCGSTDDTGLEKRTTKEYTLSGADLTKATDLWAALKTLIEADEGL